MTYFLVKDYHIRNNSTTDWIITFIAISYIQLCQKNGETIDIGNSLASTKAQRLKIQLKQVFSSFFVVLACHLPVLDGFD